MKAEFSEFSYGFAITHELLNSDPDVRAAPFFPSLIAEDRLGYDLRLNHSNYPTT